MSELSNISNQSKKVGEEEKEVERTVEYWRSVYVRGMSKHIFEMVIYENGFEERDRLTKSRLESLMNLRKIKRLS